MDGTVGFGFVGAGEIAVASAQAVRDAPSASLVAVFDVRSDLASDLSDRFGGRAVASLDEMLAEPGVDAAYICVPHFLHRETALRAAEAGKPVFIEKPMGVTPAEAQAIVDACSAAGVACGVAFVVRQAPAYRSARELVSTGAIGDVTGFRITYRGDKPASYWTGGWSGRATGDWRMTWAEAGGGVLLMNTIHDLDAILWITHLTVERVEGAIATISGPGEVEDVGVAILSCKGGAIGSIEAQAALPGEEGPGVRWVNRIYGSEGQILLPTPWGDGPLALFTRSSGEWREVSPVRRAEARTLAFEDFAAAILRGTAPPVPGEDGVRASRIVHGVYEAARNGRPVSVGPQPFPPVG
jgi:predicted dehydrogenase